MKIEFQHQYNKRHRLPWRERLVAYLPRYAPYAAHFAALANLRNAVPALRRLGRTSLGLAAERSLPEWRREIFRGAARGPKSGRDVVLFADTFTTYFEPENGTAALDVLSSAGYRVEVAAPEDGGRPLCCGRTFLAAGLVDEARYEMRRTLAGLKPALERGAAIVGLEPSCLLTLRDELTAMGLGAEAALLAGRARLFEEFLAEEKASGRLALELHPIGAAKALLHGHCHQKAFAAMGAVETALKLVPGLAVETVASSCCGMAGAFGYQAETFDVSMRMAEANLLPAMRAAAADTILVADGTSCRHQIRDGAGREALHVARVLAGALAPAHR